MIPDQNNLTRRHWMSRVLQSAAGASLLPVLMAEPGSDWRPASLNAEQNETLISLADRIIPGSAAAGCNRVIDLILSIDSDQNRARLTRALVAFDQAAHSQHSKPFRSLDAQQQDAILAAASASSSPLSPEFALLKEWVADAYWSSQQGLRELGWTGRVAWASFEGCPHAGTGH